MLIALANVRVLKVASYGRARGLLQKPGWKSLPVTNSLAKQKFVNYGQKNFIALAPGENVTKLFTTISSKFS
jgi:hypothetical protein